MEQAAKRSVNFTDENPKYIPILKEVSNYIVSLRNPGEATGAEPSTKKRKLDVVADVKTENGVGAGAWDGGPVLTVEGVSFSVPARKKFTLQLFNGGIKAVSAAGDSFELLYKDIREFIRNTYVCLANMDRLCNFNASSGEGYETNQLCPDAGGCGWTRRFK